MGKYNIVINLAKQAANFTKICGKTSILQTKAPKFAKVDFSKLGVVFPTKKTNFRSGERINFQSIDAAEEYTKNSIIKALKNNQPYEKSIITNKNKILSQINGNGNSVAVDTQLKYSRHFKDRHGHPDTYMAGCTNPVSLADYRGLFGEYGVNEIKVYNSLGEFSQLTKKRNKFISFLPKKIQDFLYTKIDKKRISKAETDFENVFINLLPENKKQRYLELKGKYTMTFKESDELYEIQQTLGSNEISAKAVHDFWIKGARKYGVEYSTNFSNLQ